MNILLVVGSTRKGSYNQMIANYIMEKYKGNYTFRQADIATIPMFSEDIEKENWPIVDKAREDVEWADGIIIVTPENNYSVPSVLKNYLDWCSRKKRVFINKPVMITGGSMGHWGTIRAQGHLRQILRSNGHKAVVVPGVEVYFPKVQDSVENNMLMEDKAGSLNKNFAIFIDYINKMNL